MPEEPLELDTRRRVFEHVSAHPGLHMRELQRQLAMSAGTLEYHLHVLVREGLLTQRRQGRYARYYVATQLGRREKDILAYLRQEIPRRVCARLLLDPEQSHSELLRHFAIAPSTLSFHLRKLLEGGVVAGRRDGRETRYRVLEPELVAKCLSEYRASFLDDLVDRFAGVWLNLAGGLEPRGEAEALPPELPRPGEASAAQGAGPAEPVADPSPKPATNPAEEGKPPGAAGAPGETRSRTPR